MSDLAKKITESEYTPSGDGWAEARRRRLVTRYLEARGFQVRAVQRPHDDGRPASKYRQADLVAQRGAVTPEGRRARATLSLLLPEKLPVSSDFVKRQKQCDSVLLSVLEKAAEFSQVELVSSPVCFGLTAQGEAQE
ncbi:MAG TPA: hypothetical protein PKW28_02360 [Turneriella sp.]|nr:hypothetical protein [Turneriella sp.]